MIKLITQFNHRESFQFTYLIERQGVLFRVDLDNKDYTRRQTEYSDGELRKAMGKFLTKFELELEYD